jgi:hypothetical protein
VCGKRRRMQTGVEKEASEVEVEVAFGVVVLEDVIGCPKFNSFFKLHKHRICLGTREVNCASEYFNLHVFVEVKEVSLLYKYHFTCHN